MPRPLGQVFTPAPLADLILTLAREGQGARGTVLDPACGDGVFLARAVAMGVAPERVHGIDIDPVALAGARARAPGCRLVHGDFFEAPVAPYDAVVGNPPYVRQEALGGAEKRRIAGRVGGVALRADLAIAFLVHALRFVKPGRRLAFVISQAALDADYASALRDLLQGEARLLALVGSPHERWFPDASLHGAIVVLERGAGVSEPIVARLRVPITEAARRVRGLADLAAVADVRRPPPAALAGPWGPLLRAPDGWFRIVEAAGDALVPLGSVAEIWRGATSGANEFFYLERARTGDIERRFLVPVLRSPKQTNAIRIDPERLPISAFVCDLDAAALRLYPGAAAHVRAHRALAARPSLAARPRWWSIPSRPARVFLTKAYDARFLQPYAERPVLADQRVYALAPRSVSPIRLAAVLNGTLTALALESLGRASMGEGALEWSVADARRLPILDPALLDAPAVEAAFRALCRRPIAAIPDELDAPDRRKLDLHLLPLPLRELLTKVHESLAQAVNDRLRRSRRKILPSLT